MLKSNKLRGPDKLKFYCQMCRKQCRDEHGFKCHMNSEFHQRKMRQFASNSQEIIEKFSKQFEVNFIDMVKNKYSGQKKKANELYMQFIDDRNHVHMNSTKWSTLTEFCEHLKTYKNILVEHREQIYITILQKDAIEFRKKTEMQKNLKQKSKQTENEWASLTRQMEKARQLDLKNHNQKKSQLQEDEPVEIGKISFEIKNDKQQIKRSSMFVTHDLENQLDQPVVYKKKCLNTEILLNKLKPKQPQIPQNQKQQEIGQEVEWILEGIIVKILPHQIDQSFHNKKAVIISIVEPYVAKLKFGDTILEIDQSYLQTVIPRANSLVKILVGKFRGEIATLDKIYAEQGYGILVFKKGQEQLNIQLPCNYFSKLATEN